MIHCPYETNRREDTHGLDPEGKPTVFKPATRCNILTAACGFIVSAGPANCQRCVDGRCWNAAGAPVLAASDESRMPTKETAQAIVTGNAHIGSMHRAALDGRLTHGDVPYYQAQNPVDIHDAFAKFAIIATRKQQEKLIVGMFEKQAKVKETDGGHPPEVLVQKMAALATEFGLEDALAFAAEEHERAALPA